MLEALYACGEMAMVSTGISFILGSLLTIFSLLMLDMLKGRKNKNSGE